MSDPSTNAYQNHSSSNKPSEKKTHHTYKAVLIVFFIILAALAAWGIVSRIETATKLKEKTQDLAILNVTVFKVQPGPNSEDLTLPGNIQAWHEAPIYARTNGYLKSWVTDIGATVKAGDLLAEIDAPDVDAQFHQAEADLATANANNQLAQLTAKRWKDLLKTNSVSKQDADDKAGDADAKAAMLASAQANLDRLKQLEDFKRVTAPFDGTVTERNTDVGSLINAGSSSTAAGQELFRISDMSKLRLYVQVPENYTMYVRPGLTAEFKLPAFQQRSFTATLDNMANAIDPTSRTLLVQFTVPNPDNELKSGGYAEVHLKVPVTDTNIRLPINTLLFRDGTQVAIVDKDNHAILKTITIGRDYGKQIEVVAGVNAGDSVVLNPPDSLANNQEVRIVTPEDKKDSAPKKADEPKPQPSSTPDASKKDVAQPASTMAEPDATMRAPILAPTPENKAPMETPQPADAKPLSVSKPSAPNGKNSDQ